MAHDQYSFFTDVPEDQLQDLQAWLPHLTFPTGTTVIAEGEERHQIYVILAGTANVVLHDGTGAEHIIEQHGSGSTLGEMSFFTSNPASATVYATTELEVLVLDAIAFQEMAAVFPRIYYNLGAILSRRLSRASHRIVRSRAGRVTVLVDGDAPALLGYALAASITWHSRESTLLVVVTDHPSSELLALSVSLRLTAIPPPGATDFTRAAASGMQDEGLYIYITAPQDVFVPQRLAVTLADLSHQYDHVLLQIDGRILPPSLPGRAVRIVGCQGRGTTLPDPVKEQGSTVICGWASGEQRFRPDLQGRVEVPALCDGDVEWLRHGLLPPATAAGRALGHAARQILGLKVGLALGAGSTKGYAHIGVLRVMERIGLVPDYLAGTSVGAGVATLVAMGHDIDTALTFLDMAGAQAFRPNLPIHSLLSMSGARDVLRKVIGDRCFEDLELPLGIVAADIITQQEVVFRHGKVAPALLASMAIPGVYPPQAVGDYLLVDGGVVNPVPADVAAALGADVVIAVKLARIPQAADATPEPGTKQPRSILHTLLQSIDIMQSKIRNSSSQGTTILLEPAFTSAQYGLRSWTQGHAYIELGEAATEAALPRIRANFPWLRN